MNGTPVKILPQMAGGRCSTAKDHTMLEPRQS